MAPGKPTKRVLQEKSVFALARDEADGVSLLKSFLELTEARLDPFSLALGAIALRCLLRG